MKLTFSALVDWEARPVAMFLTEDGAPLAFAVLSPGEEWTPVSAVEVDDSGTGPMSPEGFARRFARRFGELDIPSPEKAMELYSSRAAD